MEVTVTSDDARNLSRAISRSADPTAMRRELNRALSSASKPVRQEMRASAIASLPSRGGLQARMAGLASQGKTTASRGGIRINFAKKGYDPRTLRGRIRHPLFGNKRFWFTNEASPTDAIETEFNEQKPVVLRAVTGAMETVARKVTNF